jgi:hypothetical protein
VRLTASTPRCAVTREASLFSLQVLVITLIPMSLTMKGGSSRERISEPPTCFNPPPPSSPHLYAAWCQALCAPHMLLPLSCVSARKG